MAKSTVIKGAGGFIVKHCGKYFKVPGNLAKHTDSAADVAKKVSTHLDDVTKWEKKKLRSHLLGPNPPTPKAAARAGKPIGETSQGIWRNMLQGKSVGADGKPALLYDSMGRQLKPENFMDDADNIRDLQAEDLSKVFMKDESGRLRDLNEATMGHMPVDAVEHWVKKGHKMSPEANSKWMNNPDNYIFEYGPDNWRNGGSQRLRYTDAMPTTDDGDWVADVPGT